MAKEAFKLRAELVERSFALTLDRGGMRRAWLRGRENLHKRYLVHVAGYNLGLIMRLLVGAGTPREFLAGASAHLMLLATAADAVTVILIVATGTEAAMLVITSRQSPPTDARLPQRAAMLGHIPSLQSYAGCPLETGASSPIKRPEFNTSAFPVVNIGKADGRMLVLEPLI